ncbi:MAG: hypothetical protein JWP01_1267 [Myxococcales bacterium]|nr:hypothetical protein [Myxococcales bacterium]
MITEARAVVTLALVAAVVVAVSRGITPARAQPGARTFAGSLQLDYLLVPTERPARRFTLDGGTVELSLKLSVDLSKNVTASVKACFACHGFEAGMAYIDLRAADELRLRVGRMTPSFGNFPVRHDPANHRLSDKPLPYDMGRMLRRDEWNEGILPAPWVDNGVEVGGTHFFPGGQATYAAFLMSGPKGTADAADFDFLDSRSGERYYVDNNSQPVVGGRVAGTLDLRRHGTLTLGGSVMAGTYDPDARLGFWIAGVDAAVDLTRLIVRAEYLVRRTDMALGADPAARFKYGPDRAGTFADYFVKDGFYVEGEIPLGGVDLLARWDGLRRAGNVLASSGLDSRASLLRYTAGLAVKVGNLRLKTSVELYDFDTFETEIATHVGIASPF